MDLYGHSSEDTRSESDRESINSWATDSIHSWGSFSSKSQLETAAQELVWRFGPGDARLETSAERDNFLTKTQLLDQYRHIIESKSKRTRRIYHHSIWDSQTVAGLMVVVGCSGSGLFGVLCAIDEMGLHGALKFPAYIITACSVSMMFVVARRDRLDPPPFSQST
jgi:hypothetical protein